jgi:hypothetical protein
VLYHVKEEKVRIETISVLADVLRVWKDGHPSSWNELRKSTEILRSYISGTPVLFGLTQ